MSPDTSTLLELESVSLEDRARLYAKYLERLAADADVGVVRRLLPAQLRTAARLMGTLADRAEAAR